MRKLLLILLVIISIKLDAQYVTNLAKNVKQTETNGYYYYLPRNIIRIDFTIEENQEFRGKYSNYAKELLNTDDFIKENKKKYAIIGLDVTTLAEADPNMIFHISTEEKVKETPKIEICLNDNGILKSFGYQDETEDNNDNIQIHEELSIVNELPESYCYIPINENEDSENDDEEGRSSSKTKLTDKEIAISIVEKIKQLRTAYFDLITGYQEVNYGTTINYMIDEIKALENKYLSMFLGYTNKKIVKKTFYIIPEDGKDVITLAKFSEIEGFNSKGGESVKINFTDKSISHNMNKLSKDEIENATYNNKIFYRTPADVTMQISIGDNIIIEKRLKISQLGNITLIPINKMKLSFDTNTGQILSISNE